MNGLNVAGALFFVAGTLILLRTVTAEGVWQVSDENIAGHDAVSTNSRGLTALSQSPHQFVVESINIGHQSFRTYFLPKFYAARLELLDSPFERQPTYCSGQSSLLRRTGSVITNHFSIVRALCPVSV
jgi:hypothetical protein